jgi:thiol-disulfide isomerase/thioredoxin
MMRFALSSLLAVALSAPGSPVRAATVQLGQTGQFQVEVKGSIEPDAKVYRSLTPPQSFLVSTAAFRRPVLITTGPTSARLLDPARVLQDPADPQIMRVDTSGPVQDLMTVRMEGPKLTVARDGVSVTLVPSPPLLGKRTLEQVVDALPEYRRSAAYYSAERAAVEQLRNLSQPVELVVFFGSWCSHCEAVIPRLVRVLQDARAPKLTVTFHGVPRGEGQDPVADELRVTTLPTGIVRRDGKEIARLEDHAWDAPETSLAAALGTRPAR